MCVCVCVCVFSLEGILTNVCDSMIHVELRTEQMENPESSFITLLD